jgi:hypothetical protein
MYHDQSDQITPAAIDTSHTIALLSCHDPLELPTPQYFCTRCQARLTLEPEHEDCEWFLRCLACGVKNLLALSFQIVGWRR